MQLTKELLDKEIVHAGNLVEQAKNQLAFAQGGLSTLQQLRGVLDLPEQKEVTDAATTDAP